MERVVAAGEGSRPAVLVAMRVRVRRWEGITLVIVEYERRE